MGKITEINKEARKIIAEVSKEHNILRCELKFKGCMRTFGLAPAHRHPRIWYKGSVKLLSNYKQFVGACQYCHEILDNRSKTSQEESNNIFNNLRGEE